MSETCCNTLNVDGDSDNVSRFFAFTDALPDIGRYFRDLENNSNEDAECDWPCESQGPWIDTFSTTEKSIYWESRNYPSLWTVYELSKQFPDLKFVLDFQGVADGEVTVQNGSILEQNHVDFDDDALRYLLVHHGDTMIRLKSGERIKVGCGDVDVICTEAEEMETKIIRKFDLVFQCDESPKIVLHFKKEDGQTIDCETLYEMIEDGDYFVEYSDDDGNESIEDNPCHHEMRIHVNE